MEAAVTEEAYMRLALELAAEAAAEGEVPVGAVIVREGAVVVKAEFQLQAGDPEAIEARMRELNRRRREKQPLHLPSAGSVFKRPEGHFAGGLIEQTGLKGLAVGGAQVSELHAGFIVNAGGATARDILELVDQVKRRVLERTGVCLEMEVRVLGED